MRPFKLTTRERLPLILMSRKQNIHLILKTSMRQVRAKVHNEGFLFGTSKYIKVKSVSMYLPEENERCLSRGCVLFIWFEEKNLLGSYVMTD